MTELDFQRVIMRERHRKAFCLPRYTPANWWECDVFELTKTGYFREFEIKISRADFFNDSKKERMSDNRPRVAENKHQLLANDLTRGPVEFYYVVPWDMIKPSEIPPFAGLIEISKSSNGRWHETLRKRAPRRHQQKLDQEIVAHARGIPYWRFHNQLQRAKSDHA